MRQIFLFILSPICLTVLGEFVMKSGINAMNAAADTGSSIWALFSPTVLLGAALIVVGGCLWLVAMSKYELSFLYPFLGISYVLIIIGSAIYLREVVSTSRYVSVVLITIGLIVISRSPNSIDRKEDL